jgi:hypothetical protein
MPFTPIGQRPESGFVRADADDDRFLRGALSHASRNIGSGVTASGANLDTVAAETFGLLDRAAGWVAERTGTSKGGAFGKLEKVYRERAMELYHLAEQKGDEDLMAQILQIIGGLPLNLLQAGGAVAVGATVAGPLAGPAVGFGGLGALSVASQGKEAMVIEGGKGVLIGALFPATAAYGAGSRATVVGGTTAALETLTGAEPKEAVLAGATTGILAAAGAKRRITARREAIESEAEPVKPPPLRKAATEKVPEPAPPVVEVTPRTQQAAAEFLSRDYADIEIPDKVINLNWRNIKGPDDFKRAVTQLVRIYSNEIDQARRGRITHEQTLRMAEELDMTVDGLLTRQKGQAFNAEQATAARFLLRDALEGWKRSADRIRTQGEKATDAERMEFLRWTARSESVMEHVLGMTAEAGRALSAFRIEAVPRVEQIRQMREMIRQAKGPKGKQVDVDSLADAVSQHTTPQGLANMAREIAKPTFGQKFVEFWINSLLSGPQTHIVNFTSNSAVSLWTIPEAYLAGGIGSLQRGVAWARGKPRPDTAYVREGNARLFGAVQGAREGLTVAWKVFRTGEALDPSTKLELLRHKAISGKLGSAIRVPGRFLVAADEFHKSVGRRQELNALAMRDALNKGLRGYDLSLHIRNFIRNPPEKAMLEAIHAGRKQTFTGVACNNSRIT